MNPLFFGYKKVLKITSEQIQLDLTTQIKNITNLDISRKDYKFLDNNSLHYLKNNEHLVNLNSFGQKFFLFATTYKNKRYCVFINKKKTIYILVRFRFKDCIFRGTLFYGEFIKTNENQWLYSITDIYSYKGENISGNNLHKKLDLINKILTNKFKKDDNFDVCKLELKKYVNYDNIENLCSEYLRTLNYKCNGIVFKNIHKNMDYILFIFPENRNDNKNNFNHCEVSMPNKKVLETINTEVCYLKPEKMDLPDSYELYCKKNGNLIKEGIAYIPDIKTSRFMTLLFKNNVNNIENIIIECKYSTKFNKWFPTQNNVEDEIDISTSDTINLIKNKFS